MYGVRYGQTLLKVCKLCLLRVSVNTSRHTFRTRERWNKNYLKND